MAGFKKRDLFKDGSILRLGMGLALPSGRTESDPWILGDSGKKHLHIQFGNGTVDPLLNLSPSADEKGNRIIKVMRVNAVFIG